MLIKNCMNASTVVFLYSGVDGENDCDGECADEIPINQRAARESKVMPYDGCTRCNEEPHKAIEMMRQEYNHQQ